MITTVYKEVSYKNDAFFKYALASQDEASKVILHFIIKEVTGIEPYESFVLNGEIVPEKMYGKKVILDIYVKDSHGNSYNIEMQIAGTRIALSKRFEYYGAKILVNQIEEGMDYNKLKPVYQIIFMDSYAPHNMDLIDKHQMYNRKGQIESEDALIHRIYIHLPVINDIAKEKSIEEMSSFEKVCYLFKNNADSAIMKTEEKVVRLLMEKYEGMKKDKPVFTLAQSIEMGEWQARLIEEYNNKRLEQRLREGIKKGRNEGRNEGRKEGRKEGIKEGIIEGKLEGTSNVLQQLILLKFNLDASKWLSTLQIEQLEQVSKVILTANTFEELQQSIK